MNSSNNAAQSIGDEKEHRCSCGQLISRVTAAGIEIKCKRCKRVLIIRWSELPVNVNRQTI